MEPLGRRFDWHSPFFVGLTASAGVAVTHGGVRGLAEASSMLLMIGVSFLCGPRTRAGGVVAGPLLDGGRWRSRQLRARSRPARIGRLKTLCGWLFPRTLGRRWSSQLSSSQSAPIVALWDVDLSGDRAMDKGRQMKCLPGGDEIPSERTELGFTYCTKRACVRTIAEGMLVAEIAQHKTNAEYVFLEGQAGESALREMRR